MSSADLFDMQDEVIVARLAGALSAQPVAVEARWRNWVLEP